LSWVIKETEHFINNQVADFKHTCFELRLFFAHFSGSVLQAVLHITVKLHEPAGDFSAGCEWLGFGVVL